MQFTSVSQRRILQRGSRSSPSVRLLASQFCTLANVVPLALGERTLASSPLPVLFLAFPENWLEKPWPLQEGITNNRYLYRALTAVRRILSWVLGPR